MLDRTNLEIRYLDMARDDRLKPYNPDTETAEGSIAALVLSRGDAPVITSAETYQQVGRESEEVIVAYHAAIEQVTVAEHKIVQEVADTYRKSIMASLKVARAKRAEMMQAAVNGDMKTYRAADAATRDDNENWTSRIGPWQKISDGDYETFVDKEVKNGVLPGSVNTKKITDGKD